MARRSTGHKAYPEIERGPRRRRSRFARFVHSLLALIVTAGILFCAKAFVVKAAKPYLLSYGQSKESMEIKRQIAEARAENKALRNEIAYLSTARGKEAEARKLGWVKQGEIAVVVEQPQQPRVEDQPDESPERESLWQIVGRYIVGLLVQEGAAP